MKVLGGLPEALTRPRQAADLDYSLKRNAYRSMIPAKSIIHSLLKMPTGTGVLKENISIFISREEILSEIHTEFW